MNKGAHSSFQYVLPPLFFIIFLFFGRYHISPQDLIHATQQDAAWILFYKVRLPRVLIAMFVGAALSAAGVALQGISRNPLVGPEILGVSSGAGFGAACAILFLGNNMLSIQLTSFLFGLLAVMISYSVSKSLREYGSSTLTLILAGISISAVFSALISILKYVADPYDDLPQIVYWLMGSFAAVTWHNAFNTLPGLIIGIFLLLLLRWRINILSLGQEEARALGINYERNRILLISAATLATAAAVSISGIISWVGLIVPHITRKLVGPDHALLMPASLSLGAVFMAGCDTIARTLYTFEIPIGIITSLVGAPLFIIMLKKGGRRIW